MGRFDDILRARQGGGDDDENKPKNENPHGECEAPGECMPDQLPGEAFTPRIVISALGKEPKCGSGHQFADFEVFQDTAEAAARAKELHSGQGDQKPWALILGEVPAWVMN